MDVERVNDIIRLSTKDIALPPKTSDEPDIVAMWFEWLARRRNFPDK
jgi:chemotaxis signal transduction protein